jgi:hypothetical protein
VEDEQKQSLEQHLKTHRRHEFHKALAGEKILSDRDLKREDVDSFLARFEALDKQWPYTLHSGSRTRRPGETQDRDQAFARLFAESGFDDDDITIIGRALLTQSRDKDLRDLGTSLLFEASDAGNNSATIRVMSGAYNQVEENPSLFTSLLQAPRLVRARQRLEQIDSAPAKVLHGRLAQMEGNGKLAAKLWTDAMEDSRRAAQELSAKSVRDALAEATDPNTSAPWSDLTTYHMTNGRYEEAKWAIDVGCQLDDPMSFYYAAWYHRADRQTEREIPTSSKWLYNISKAAASGQPRAMHELGCWYVLSRWPYLTDDVPDSMRPSPFDSYPPEEGVVIEQTVEGSVFATAAFPETAKGRILMADCWFSLAISLGFAPSCLASAMIHLMPTLDGNMAIPFAALNVTDKRYRYKDKAAYDAGIPSPDENTTDPLCKSVPNPLYGGQYNGEFRAAYLIREIFFADAASKIKAAYVQQNKRRSKQVNPEASQQYPPSVTKWLQYHISFSDFMHDGLLYDESDVSLDKDDRTDLLTKAKRICDEQNWEIYDDDGGLLYRPNLQTRMR